MYAVFPVRSKLHQFCHPDDGSMRDLAMLRCRRYIGIHSMIHIPFEPQERDLCHCQRLCSIKFLSLHVVRLASTAVLVARTVSARSKREI
jgi:hypothetical protein